MKVVIAEDEFFSREGIRKTINEQPEFEVIGCVGQGQDAIDLIHKTQAEILVLDIRMPPGIDGLEVIKILRQENNPIKILALTNEKRVIRKVEKAGADGYVPKEKYQMLIPALNCVSQLEQKVFISPEFSEQYQLAKQRLDEAELSDPELEVLALLPYRNEEIAKRCFKSLGRVRNLVTEIYFKLDLNKEDEVSQRYQAIELARTLGILKVEDRDKCNGEL